MGKQGVKRVVPKLRFPEFRSSEGWIRGALGELFSERRESGFANLLLLSLTDKEGIIPQEESNRKDNSNADKSKYLRVVPGDIAYNTMRMWEGRSAYVGIEGIISPAYTVCAPNEEVNSRFFSYYFKIGPLIEQFRRYSQGLVKDTFSLKYENFERIEIAFPRAEVEQKKVAECLTSLDEVIAAQGRKVEALKVQKLGLMQQLFPRGGETCPRLRFPEFRNAPDWMLGKASDIVEVLQGYGFPESLQGNREGEFPFYKVSDISACIDAGGVSLDEANNHIDGDILNKLRAKLMPVGATVFAKIGEAIRSNKRAITSRPCLVDNNAAGIKAIAGLAHDRFVYYLWCQVPLIEYAGGVVPAVNKSAIEQVPVYYPKLDEQQHIADCLSSLDAVIVAESAQLTALKTHKQGLMQQLFPVQRAG